MARLGIAIEYSQGFRAAADELIAYENAGADLAVVSEAYSADGVSRLGYLAAVTTKVTLASGILQFYTRTPTLLAATAASLDELSEGRFELGIGASGPQVIEGFHGVPYTAPLGRTREVVDICRLVWSGERAVYPGKYYQLPLPADQGMGLGKPLKMIGAPGHNIPIHIAALTPKAVAQAAEIADGWMPILFWPEKARQTWGAALDEGTAKRTLEKPLDTIVTLPLYLGLGSSFAIKGMRKWAALYIGGMGAKGKNFYNDLVSGYGYADVAERIQDLYLAGKKDEAAALVPDELLKAASLIGSKKDVEKRLAALHDAGVTSIVVQPVAPKREARLGDFRTLRAMLG